MRRTGSVFKLMAGGVEVVLLTAVAAYAEPGVAESFFRRFKWSGAESQVADTTAFAPPTVSGSPDLTSSGRASQNGTASAGAAQNGSVLFPLPQSAPAPASNGHSAEPNRTTALQPVSPPSLAGPPPAEITPSETRSDQPQPGAAYPVQSQPCPVVAGPPAVVYRRAPLYAPATVYRPVVRLAPMPRSVTVGRGVVGQPTIYVPGQPVRNFLRWLSP